MCHELNAEPPLQANERGNAYGEELILTSADGTQFTAYAAHTGTPAKSGVVILPDARGLFHFYKELALRFADTGCETIAIDYFGRTAGLTPRNEQFGHWPHAQKTHSDTIAADIAAALSYLRARPNAPQALFTVGFCFGGCNSFLQGANNQGLAGVIGFYGVLAGTPYGSPTPLERVHEIRCPVLGLFGGADTVIAAEHVQTFDEGLDQAGVEHEIVTYPGAPHSFFDRSQDQYANESADAWKRVQAFIATYAANKLLSV